MSFFYVCFGQKKKLMSTTITTNDLALIKESIKQFEITQLQELADKIVNNKMLELKDSVSKYTNLRLAEEKKYNDLVQTNCDLSKKIAEQTDFLASQKAELVILAASVAANKKSLEDLKDTNVSSLQEKIKHLEASISWLDLDLEFYKDLDNIYLLKYDREITALIYADNVDDVEEYIRERDLEGSIVNSNRWMARINLHEKSLD